MNMEVQKESYELSTNKTIKNKVLIDGVRDADATEVFIKRISLY